MRIVELVQGTKEWHEHRKNHLNASDAPAMVGKSLYKSRTQLLIEKKTGIIPEINSNTQVIFDKGHKYEAAAREIIEQQEGVDLYPVTGVKEIDSLLLSASFDGIDLNETFCFEHKTRNKTLATVKSIDDLDKQYKIQMQQQLMVSDCNKCLFVASNGDKESMVQFWYESDEQLAKEIIAGWHQFQKDLEVFETPREEVKPEIKALMELPSLSISIHGEVSNSNLDVYKSAAIQFISEINTDLQTDEDFAQAEIAIKFCDNSEKELESVKKQALAQTADIDLLFKTVDHLKEEMRSKRLTLNKLVKAQKEAIKINIVNEAQDQINSYASKIEIEFEGVSLGKVVSDFSGVIKSKRNLASMRDAVDTELARLKIQLNETASQIRENLNYLKSLEDYKFLFNDLRAICQKPFDDFKNLVDLRISEHKKKEQEKLDLERERIRQEEQDKLHKNIVNENKKPNGKVNLKTSLQNAENRCQDETTKVIDEKWMDGKLQWITSYIGGEDFSIEQIEAICTIISLFDESEESKKEIFEFVEMMKVKYK